MLPCGGCAASGGGRLVPAVEKDEDFFGGFGLMTDAGCLTRVFPSGSLLVLGHPQLGQNKCDGSLVCPLWHNHAIVSLNANALVDWFLKQICENVN